ncbi:hypothetical protein [Terasakiella sp. SH-1]|uniref:hypothetical protein n=1 Tax=Terasakiella sp. SH-1 TaxID=2560057 RepID=UPI001073305C|nr:hypothetical protein [Terasakiella sp. SH-1]
MSKALVVYSDNSGLWWLRFLRPGFRHCFIILETDRGHVWVDPMSHHLTIKVLEGYELTGLISWYHEMGMRVQSVEIAQERAQAFPWAPMSCVEVVKRLLGIRDCFVQTPWQLYQYIKRTKSENIGNKVLTFV